ncbi:hypothetical protein [Thermoflavimicrobium daqui]|nr:hypothetical protein [Thermoflavimicrobium daqui]
MKFVGGQPVLECCFRASCPGYCYKDERGFTVCTDCDEESGPGQ